MDRPEVELSDTPDATDEDLRKMAEELEWRAENAVNDLHRLIIVAEILSAWYRANVKGTVFQAFFEEDGWGRPMSAPNAEALSHPAESIEVAGVLGMYTWMLRRPELNVLFANDLAQEIHGLDAVACDPKRNRFVLLESKGTTRPLRAVPGSYLRQTKTKGRQLSLDWCWRSLTDFAGFVSTAPIFLRLVGPFLDARCERLLVVTEVTRVEGGFRPGDSREFDEAAIREALDAGDAKDFNKQREWLAEIRSIGQFPDVDYKWPPR